MLWRLMNFRPSGFFEAFPLPVEVNKPAWHDDEEKKKLFGIELGREPRPFIAACEVFKNDTTAALWASINWITDPVVIAAKDLYLKVVEDEENLLDKKQLSLRLLAFAEERDQSGRFYVHDGKDRLAALKLYAEVQGYIGKLSIDNSTHNFTSNEMRIILVAANNDNKEIPVIEASANGEPEEIDIPFNIKLVK